MTATGMTARLMKLGIPVVFPEYHYQCRRSGSQYVISQLWLSLWQDYSYKQALWSVGKWQHFLWICIVTYVARIWERKDRQDQKGVQQYAAFPAYLTDYFCHVLFGKNILSLFISR